MSDKKINRKAMLDRLRKASKQHLKVFQEAREECRAKYLDFLREETELAREPEWHPNVATSPVPICRNLAMPEDRRQQFNAWIKQLESGEEDFVTISDGVYNELFELLFLNDLVEA